MSTLKRAVSILQGKGFSYFCKKAFHFAGSAVRYHLFPQQDERNTNWHRYIKDLDARVEIMRASPWKLEIESTSVCNLQCIMCTHVFAHPRIGKHFNMALLTRLAHMLPAAGEFQLMGSGEPLISPAFWKIMDIIGNNPSYIQPSIGISSNAAAMTPHIAAKLLHSPLREVSFSLDAATPDTYRKIRNGEFSRTVEHIRHLLQCRQKNGGKSPRVMLNMTLMRENIDELTQFIKLAHALGVDAVQFWPLHDYGDIDADGWNVERNGWKFNYRDQMLGQDEADAQHANTVIEDAVALAEQLGVPIIWPMGGRTRISPAHNNSAASAPPPATTPATRKHKACPIDCVAPWEWMLVNVNGDVRPCCHVQQTFGNIRQQTPEEIWNGAEYREMRRHLAQGKLPPQCRNASCKYVRGNWMYSDASD